MQINPMTRVRLYVRLKRTGRRETFFPLRRNRSRSAPRVETVTTTKGQIVRSGNEKNRPREGTLHGHTADGQEFAHGDGLFVLFREGEDVAVEVGLVEKEVLVGVSVGA